MIEVLNIFCNFGVREETLNFFSQPPLKIHSSEGLACKFALAARKTFQVQRLPNINPQIAGYDILKN